MSTLLSASGVCFVKLIKKISLLIISAVLACGVYLTGITNVYAAESPFRTIVTSDAEIDDVASFHRLLLHMNDMSDSLEAVIYSSSTFHWAGDPNANPPIPAKDWAGSDVFQQIINGTGKWGKGGGYAAVVNNLKLHDPKFPSVEHMLSLIKVGNVTYRGEMKKDSEGSNFIKQAMLDNDPRPLFLQVWGGTNTIAAALRSIEDEYKGTDKWDEIYRHVTAKVRLYVILDQDEVYKDYIDPHWPDLDIIVNRDQFWTVAYYTYRTAGIRGLPRVPDVIEDAYFSPEFIHRLRTGPLMSSYPVSADRLALGSAGYPDTESFLSEGDSPSYFYLLSNGLNSWKDPTYGGWGGRFAKVTEHRWSDFPSYITDKSWKFDDRRYGLEASRVRDVSPYPESYDVAYPTARFIPALQQELAARSQWQTVSYKDANHPPVVSIADGKTEIVVQPGEKVPLNGIASDPDNNKLVVHWWQYQEAGTYPNIVDIARPSALDTSFLIPTDARPGQTIHMILEVQDRAQIPITRYARLIATVGNK
ncbi:nucleoside hydrolase-like domain-containing protein [Sodalis sp. RH21]|uniref:DUF1593 domain-containing protein n=1 Tax=unclassified Sodalis (in: enterobacteria) TaxID=2636512 RepID=UPI0039B56175